MNKRLIVIPRWAGTPKSDWYPWIQRTLEAMQPQPFDPVVIADMPNPDQPTISAWVGRVKELLGADAEQIAQTIIVGHSVGCQAVLRALAGQPQDVQVGGVLCVAGWFWTDAPWDSLMPWIKTPIDLERVRSVIGQKLVVMISTNDMHTADWQANRRAWQERLDAEVIIVPGANHFNGEQYPEILQALVDTFINVEKI